ncbi:glycosyltransferase family 39 protein [Lyngbya sp. CCY1209]|uniref:glycosyltransferase family 39 protein n=1 Tax=Lyngbya sp. CCY1209 TaxID=2886103 RepID=UPI002D204FD3|nr:glycosyltransferase family 39 protein [Lyngbya sp. CCY1209]MEB3885280.1 glycosyltransferase family 39 protein [Lyngbya sp. CCY1209]
MIWLLGAIGDRIWFARDRSVPAWDPADYLTGSLTYWRALQDPRWLSGDWWTHLWTLSPKVPPLTYLLSVPFQNLFGTGPESANLVHLLFSAILLGSVYAIAARLFDRRVGLWAAGLCLLMPALYQYRLGYLLDYPLTAMVALSFGGLTMWKEAEKPRSQWLWAIAFGLFFGLAILVKQTALFFLFVPLLWLTIGLLKRRDWRRLFQLAIGLFVSVLIFGPWAKANWLLMLTSGKRATVDSAIAEGDPSLTSPDAWTYYFKLLPLHVSWPLLLVPIVGFSLYFIRKQSLPLHPKKSALTWLFVYLIGGYFICSLNPNKDFRYGFPLLPILSIFLAWGLTLWPRRWGATVRWGTVAVAVGLMLLTLWPFGGVPGQTLRSWLSPGNTRHAQINIHWPHQEAIAEVLAAEPHLENNIGVLPSTPNLNQHNINYYGALQDFQIYGRQVGTAVERVPQDARSLCWFITKTGAQGSVDRIGEAQAMMVSAIVNGPPFQLQKSWPLPDGSRFDLYRCTPAPVEVSPLPASEISPKVKLDAVILPEKTPPGVPVPVSYYWSGSKEELESGLVVLTWTDGQGSRWIHDRAIASGRLHFGETEGGFQVVERMAMLPPPDAAPGIYRLEATYLNQETGENYAIASPPVTLEIDPAAAPSPAPELDLVTQLRQLALYLPEGIEGLELIFDEIGRINQYDPIQDYTIQAQKTLEYRLTREPDNLNWAYGLALSAVLRQDVESAIAALERVKTLDPENPFAHAYLAFVHLYNFDPEAAETALKPALELSPNQPEFLVLRGTANLLRGRIFRARQDLQALNRLSL